MSYDKDKVDECTLALLYLVLHNEDKYGARAWKGFDWDTMNRLYEKGYIDNPVGKAKAVFIFSEGVKKAKELFHRYFVEYNRKLTHVVIKPFLSLAKLWTMAISPELN